MVSNKVALIKYVNWLKKADPRLWALIKVKYPSIFLEGKTELNGWTDIDWGGIANKVVDTVSKALPVIQQQKIFDTNLKLAKMGKPMIDPASIKLPGIPIHVELPPEIQQEVLQTAKSAQGGLNMVTMAGIGIAAFFLLNKKRRK